MTNRLIFLVKSKLLKLYGPAIGMGIVSWFRFTNNDDEIIFLFLALLLSVFLTMGIAIIMSVIMAIFSLASENIEIYNQVKNIKD